jgi:hypothetical protein
VYRSGVKRTDDQILAAYLDGERLKVIPAKRSKKLIVLRWLVERFKPGVDYPESAVNAMIKVAHEDFATLRRELYDNYMLDRKDGIYHRRLPEPRTSVTDASVSAEVLG